MVRLNKKLWHELRNKEEEEIKETKLQNNTTIDESIENAVKDKEEKSLHIG